MKRGVINGRIIVKWIFRKLGVRVWPGVMWLRMGNSGELL
jgi:hypothetical protein